MPATERTYYNMRRLHVVFAISSVLLLLATVWMLARDHFRCWKEIQRKTDRIEIRLARWKQLQARTDTVVNERKRLKTQWAELMSRPFSEETLEAFRSQVRSDAKRRGAPLPSFEKLNEAVLQLERAAKEADTARKAWHERQLGADKARLRAEDAALSSGKPEKEGDGPRESESQDLDLAVKQAERKLKRAEAEMRRAQAAVVPLRRRVLKELNSFISQARFREDKWERGQGSASAELDMKKSRLGLGVRDRIGDEQLKRLQDDIEGQKQKTRHMKRAADAAKAHRRRLQDLLAGLTERVSRIRKRMDELRAESERLDQLLAERRSTYFNYWGVLPVPGKKWLELPFLDVFNSPRRIETLWSQGLDRPAGSFGRVPRFDRCTTCHQRLGKTVSDAPSQSATRQSATIDFALSVPESMNEARRGEFGGDSEQLKSRFGLVLADEGLIDSGEVTVQLVDASGPSGKARQWRRVEKEMKAEQIRRQFWYTGGAERHKPSYKGLRLGDVIVAIDGQPVPEGGAGRQWVTERLLEAARSESGGRKLIRVTVRRGLPHPYAQHPRLDLFVDEDSPHKASKFGCTVCHAGQGSATAFKWASHTPNDLQSRSRWREQYDWFDNPHWNDPMRPRQFMESSCLKCHHDVVELERNSEFADAAAPKLVKGYRLIRTLGCFGCHEIRGHDHSNKRTGPDLRLEPNYHAAALQLTRAAGTGHRLLTTAEKKTVQRLVDNPEDDSLRKTLLDSLRNHAEGIAGPPTSIGFAEGGGAWRCGERGPG
ncbi:MAG: hypothetical protein ACODAD_04455 [Planctomycetota bacterium]